MGKGYANQKGPRGLLSPATMELFTLTLLRTLWENHPHLTSPPVWLSCTYIQESAAGNCRLEPVAGELGAEGVRRESMTLE